jgi:dipeptidyl aminopeptidase/acylaminoacyl peptidase
MSVVACALSLLLVPATPDDAWPDPAPTLAQIFQAPDLLGLRPGDVRVSADGRWTTYTWTAEHTDEPERDLWLVDTGSGEARVLFTHDEEAEVHWSRSGSLALVERGGWLERYDPADDADPVPFFQTGGSVSVQFLEDGRRVLVRTSDRQAWILDLGADTRTTPAGHLEGLSRWHDLEDGNDTLALFAEVGKTGDGGGESRLHLLGLRDGKTTVTELDSEGQLDVSPDGFHVLVTQVDREETRDLIMADYLTEFVTAVPVRDSLAGDPASRRSLELYDVEGGQRRDLPVDGTDRAWILRTSWSPSGDHLLLDRVSADTHVRQILVVEPFSGKTTLVHTERDDAWIGGPYLWSGWRAETEDDDEQVLFTSEHEGFNHLYTVDVAGGLPRALTAGSYEVAQVTLLDDSDQALLVAHAEDDPAVTQLMLLSLADGSHARLTSASGCASRPRLSDDGSTVVYRWATLGQPWELHALRLDEGGGPVRLSHTIPASLDEFDFPVPEIIEYENPDDGATVRAYLYRPVPFDPAKTYPAVMFVHGAGYLQQVKRSMSSYEVNMLFHHRLTRMGFAVIDPDFRHSRGYGRDFRTGVHGFMGGKDLDDCVAGVDYLKTLGWVDTSRVGVYGGSYGGFLVLMALFTQPDVYAAGAALRSVTDWRVYNHWYTNPRLGDPVADAEAYAKSSPIDHVDGLTKPLLLLHGLKDSNVFAQDTIRLMEELIERGLDFDAMLYPSQGHGFDDPDSWVDEYKRIERLFVRELKPGS